MDNEEVRMRRLLGGRQGQHRQVDQGDAGEAPPRVDVFEDLEVEQVEEQLRPVPVASSTLLSPPGPGPTSPQAQQSSTACLTTTTPSSWASTSTALAAAPTTVFVVTGREAQDLLRTLTQQLASGVAVTTAAGVAVTTAEAMPSGSGGLTQQACSADRISPNLPRRKHMSPENRKSLGGVKFHDSRRSKSSSSDDDGYDDDDYSQRVKRRRLNVVKKSCAANWRESLPSTSYAGLRNEDDPPKPQKRKPGRPKGSKNKKVGSNASQVSQNSSCRGLGVSCKICRDGVEGGPLCLTECGHLFHVHCLEQWIRTSNQKYRTLKVFPLCGGSYEKYVPFIG